jgi:hypothetical protein
LVAVGLEVGLSLNVGFSEGACVGVGDGLIEADGRLVGFLEGE